MRFAHKMMVAVGLAFIVTPFVSLFVDMSHHPELVENAALVCLFIGFGFTGGVLITLGLCLLYLRRRS